MSFSLLNNRISQKIVFLTAVTALVACDDFSLGKKTQAKTTENKTEQVQKENQAIDIFNQNVAIKVERSVVTLSDGSVHVKFDYLIKNRGKANIRSILWNPVHIFEDKILYTVPIQVNFDTDFKPEDEFSVTTDYDVDKLQKSDTSLTPEAAKLLIDPKAPIKTLILAKGILFANGDKLEVH